MESQYKNIGITGAKGFMGKIVAARFLDLGITTECFEGDLLQDSDLENYFTKHYVDQIIHLVGTFDPPFENQIKLNVLTTQKLLEAGVKHGLKKIIFASTGAVYGEPIKDESFETDPLTPNTLYGLSKMCAEECIKYYATNYGIKYIILRFPNVYGEGSNKGVVFNFLNDIRQTSSVTVYGDGKQSRNFLHVSDACAAIEKSVFSQESGIFNISNPVKVSINDLVRMFADKYKFTINHKEANNNLKDLLLNIEKAQKILGFNPEVKDIKI